MKETNGVLWHETGARLAIENRGTTCDPAYRYALRIGDLNPEVEIDWCMSRGEMLRIGWWIIRRTLTARP